MRKKIVFVILIRLIDGPAERRSRGAALKDDRLSRPQSMNRFSPRSGDDLLSRVNKSESLNPEQNETRVIALFVGRVADDSLAKIVL